jgi:hypothetical protein
MPNDQGRPNHARDNDDDVGYFDLDRLAKYSGLSVSSLRRFLKDKDHPLPHHRITGTGRGRGRLLVSKREFDEWVARFAAAANATDFSWIRERD